MATPKRSPAERERDLDTISRKYLTGCTQAEIAKRLNVSRQQIGYDLKVLQKRWQESALANIDAKKAEELARVDALERTYWKAWRRSCEDKEVKIAEKTTGGEADKTKAATRREGQSGNPAFLAGIQWCIAQRCKLLGIEADKTVILKGDKENPLAITVDELVRARNRTADWRKDRFPEVAPAENHHVNGTNGTANGTH